MRRVTLILIAIAVCTLNHKAQETTVEKLLALEKKFFFSNNDTMRNHLLLEKANIYFQEESISPDASNAVKRLTTSLLVNEEEKNKFLFNASLLFYLNNDFNNAKNYFASYLASQRDTSMESLLLGTLIYNQYDTLMVNTFLRRATQKDSSVACLECLNKVFVYELKHKKLLRIMSYIVPGSGTIASGYIGKGLTSLAVTTGLATGIYFLVANKLYFNAAFAVFPWFAKFYGGQTRLTKKMTEQKESLRKNKMASSCAEKLSVLLQKYPLRFNVNNP
jgi:hypothetical protein